MLSLILPYFEGKQRENKKFSAIWDFWRVATITSKGEILRRKPQMALNRDFLPSLGA